MAFTFSQKFTGNTTGGSGSYTTAAFGSSLTVGKTIIAVVASNGTGANEITSLTDSAGNSYTKDIEYSTGNSLNRYVSIWRAPVITGGSGVTITINFASTTTNVGIAAQEWASGGTLTLDATGNNAGSATTSPSVSTTGSTTVANELVVAGFVSNSSQASFTVGTGYSNADFKSSTSSNPAIESKTISSTGTQTATGTWGTSRSYGAVIVTYYEAVTNVAPNTPTLSSPADTGTVGTVTPTLQWSDTDTDNNDISYEVQISTSAGFGSGLDKLSSTDAGFIDVTNGADTDPFATGDTISYTVQAGDALTNSTTYYWRVRGKDPAGTNTWGSWSSTRSFTTSSGAAPNSGFFSLF